MFIIPVIIANIHAAVFPFYFILFLPYIGEYFVCLLGESGLNINKFKLKRLKKEKSEDSASKVKQIKDRIAKLEERKQKSKDRAYKIITNKNNNVKWLILIMLFCVFAGLITPIGDIPYMYVYNKMIGDTMNHIGEHLPTILVNNLNLIAVLIIFLAILMFTDTKIRLSDLFMLGGLVALTFYSRRQMSMLIIAGALILARLIGEMFVKYDSRGPKNIEIVATKLLGQVVIITVMLIFSFELYRPKLAHEFVDPHQYPIAAADFILENLDLENIRLYNEYNYGAYLIYRGIPVFIDSRASLYAPEFNPGVYVFRDFINISSLNIRNIEERLDYYEITHLLMFSNARLRLFINQNPEVYNQIYYDGRFVIYERRPNAGQEEYNYNNYNYDISNY